MSKAATLWWMAVGLAVYTPFSMLVFSTTAGEMFSRAYFMLGGAAFVLYFRER